MNSIISLDEFKKKTAILILAFADYESLELALATHAKFSIESGVHIYILQNGRGSYDCERTYLVGQKYHFLYPDKIDVIDNIPQGPPYISIKMLFSSSEFDKYDYIIKLDDDVLVLTPNWVDKLCSTYIEKKSEYGEKLAYVSTLVNNNAYGFSKILEYNKDLSDEYFSKIAKRHMIGSVQDNNWGPYAIVEKEYVHPFGNGTIWRNANIARWLHTVTTMKPEEYISRCESLPTEEVHSKERFSINCMLFEKKYWFDIDDGGTDDEFMCQKNCLRYNKKIFANLSIPMIHIAFFVQRNEIRDMIDEIRDIYTRFLALNFPITMCNNRLIEIENRLRFMENQHFDIYDQGRNSGIVRQSNSKIKGFITVMKKGVNSVRNYGIKHTFMRIKEKMGN